MGIDASNYEAMIINNYMDGLLIACNDHTANYECYKCLSSSTYKFDFTIYVTMILLKLMQ